MSCFQISSIIMSDYLRDGEIRVIRELIISATRYGEENPRKHRVLVASQEFNARDTRIFLRSNYVCPRTSLSGFVSNFMDSKNVLETHLVTCGSCGHLQAGEYPEAFVDGNPESKLGLTTSNIEARNVFCFF